MSQPSRVDEQFLENSLAQLSAARSWPPETLEALATFVRLADDYDLFRVNPIRYAAEAGLTETDAIDLFLHAAKVGLFQMDWLVLCAYCPQVAGGFRELNQVHPRFQCAFCNAINDVALDDYIQVAFTVADKVRDIVYRHPETLPVEDYYLRYNFAKGFVPPHGMTPAQIVALLSRQFADLGAREKRTFELDVTAGRFEILDLSHKLLLVFFVDGEGVGLQTTSIRLDDGRFLVPDRPTAPREMVLGDGRFVFNQTADLRPGRHRFEIENRMDKRGRLWFVQYPPGFAPHRVAYEPFLSGKRLLLTPSFAELYKGQLVDEGEGLTVSDITYLFTDLKESTPLYDSVGDLNAYFLVRQHFEILNRIVRQQGGALVKTIGDAVMAAFDRPRDAVAAGIAMVEELARFNRTAARPLGLKIGIHKGQAIAVTLNERIDYFGQDVNIAARVQGLAGVDEICVTEAVMSAPGVADLVGSRPTSRAYVQLKGVGQKQEMHRIALG
ncbi:MAG: DUF5939 domain-containing protein [Geminicoccaceae bacterium]